VLPRGAEHGLPAQGFGRVAVVDPLEVHHPAAACGAGRHHDPQLVADDELRSGREPLVDVAHGDHVHLAAQPVRPAHAPNLQEDGFVGHPRGLRRYSATSTVTRTPSVAPAARPTWRSAWMTRPRLPMMRPRSPGLVWIRIDTLSERSVESTKTPSGSSTSWRATSSTTVLARAPVTRLPSPPISSSNSSLSSSNSSASSTSSASSAS